MEHYDLAVIGGGSAGQTAAIIAGRVGARVVLIDRQSLGGDCLHHGCVPSKALIRCAKAAHQTKTASRFGVTSGKVLVDYERVYRYVQDAIAQVAQNETPDIMRSRGIEVAFGGATFLSPTTLQVGDKQIEATRTIVAAGSRAAPPKIEGLSKVQALDHVSLFEMKIQPERLVVIGGGPIGVEMGQALARLGTQVTMLQRGPRIMTQDDPQLAEMLLGYLEQEMNIITQAAIVRVERDGDSTRVWYEHQDHEHSIECDGLLVATGRKPDLEDLGLNRAGVETNSRGVIVDDYLRTTAKNIWAAGDCTGSYQFTHFAEAQGRTAARNALFSGKQKFAEQAVPWTTFCDPELAQVGLLEEQAKQAHPRVEVFHFGYDELDRAICDGSGRGLAKLICTAKGRILGASLLGPGAGDAICELALAMKAGLTISQVSSAIHVYPTLNRIVRRLGDQRFMDKGLSPWTVRLFGRFKGKDN